MDYKIKREEHVRKNTEIQPIDPDQRYDLTFRILAKEGLPFSSYIAAIVLDEKKSEIKRFIKWINKFSKTEDAYHIIFRTPKNAKYVTVGYRLNIETPVKSDLELSVQDVNFTKTHSKKDEFDSLENFTIPKIRQLNNLEEDKLETKLVWVMGWPRSGTTWLATQLLNHEKNVIWNEPFIAYHLDPRTLHLSTPNYFFSPVHKQNWMPGLRKMILNRAFSQSWSFSKNIVIKEPLGGRSAEVLMETLPDSRMIFLLRDGRDIIDSLIDAHQKGSWNKELKPFANDNERFETIKKYAMQWVKTMKIVEGAYLKHKTSLRLKVKYEELRLDTFAHLKRIYDFLGISISDDIIKKIVEKYDFKNISRNEKGKGKFNRFAIPGLWKINLSAKEKKVMNEIMEKTLKDFDYEL